MMMHVHAVKGDAECKYWLQPERFDILEEFQYNCTPRLRREIRQIIFERFDQIIVAWREHFGENRAERNPASFGEGYRDHTRSPHCDHGNRVRLHSLGKVLTAACPGIASRAKPS
jgi:hypothetical protein